MLALRGLYANHMVCCGCPLTNEEEDTVFVVPHPLTDSVFSGGYDSVIIDDTNSAGVDGIAADIISEVGDSDISGSNSRGDRSSTALGRMLRQPGPSRTRPSCEQLGRKFPIDIDDNNSSCSSSSALEDPGEPSPSVDCSIDDCAICLTSLADRGKGLPGSYAVTLPCGHVLHDACLEALRAHLRHAAAGRPPTAAKCPLCRMPVVGDLDKMVETLRLNKAASADELVQAARVLGSVGPAGAQHAEVLARCLAEEDRADVRCALVWAIGQMGEAVLLEYHPALVERLGDDDAAVCEEVQHTFQEAGTLGARILVVALMQPTRSKVIWQACSNALEAMGSQAGRALAELLAHDDGPAGSGPADKCRAIVVLSRLGGKVSAPGARVLVALLSGSPCVIVRRAAASALGIVCRAEEFEGQSLGIAVLAAALAEKDDSVRQTSVAALSQLGKAAAPHITAMLHVLRHRQPATQTHVLEGLGLVGNRCFAGKPLEQQLREGIVIFPVSCQTGLARLLKDDNASIRAATIKALQQMGVVGAIVLSSQLGGSSSDPQTSALCAKALRQMGDVGSTVLQCGVQTQPTIVARELQIPEAGVAQAEHLIEGQSASEGRQSDMAKSIAYRVELLIQAEKRS